MVWFASPMCSHLVKMHSILSCVSQCRSVLWWITGNNYRDLRYLLEKASKAFRTVLTEQCGSEFRPAGTIMMLKDWFVFRFFYTHNMILKSLRAFPPRQQWEQTATQNIFFSVTPVPNGNMHPASRPGRSQQRDRPVCDSPGALVPTSEPLTDKVPRMEDNLQWIKGMQGSTKHLSGDKDHLEVTFSNPQRLEEKCASTPPMSNTNSHLKGRWRSTFTRAYTKTHTALVKHWSP